MITIQHKVIILLRSWSVAPNGRDSPTVRLRKLWTALTNSAHRRAKHKKFTWCMGIKTREIDSTYIFWMEGLGTSRSYLITIHLSVGFIWKGYHLITIAINPLYSHDSLCSCAKRVVQSTATEVPTSPTVPSATPTSTSAKGCLMQQMESFRVSLDPKYE